MYISRLGVVAVHSNIEERGSKRVQSAARFRQDILRLCILFQKPPIQTKRTHFIQTRRFFVIVCCMLS